MKSCVYLFSAILCGLFLSPAAVMVKIKNNGVRNKRNTEINAEHEKFMIPKTLKLGDEIKVTGNMTLDRRKVIVSLVMHNEESKSPDFDNIACQLMATFPTDLEPENNVTIHTVVKGEHQDPLLAEFEATEIFEEPEFEIRFIINGSEENIEIDLILNDSASASSCILRHDLKDIKYLTLGGHIHKVDEIYFLLA